MKQKKDYHGMALITILLMMVILVMLTIALITVNSNNLLYTLNYNNRVSALMAAESGVAYAIYELQHKSDWRPSNATGSTSNGKFTMYFKPGTTVNDYYSINNLELDGADPNGYRGATVPPDSVDLIVTGQAGSTVRRIRVTLGRANISEGGRCSGQTDIEAANFIIKRAPSSKDTNEGGSFHSNFKNPLDPNIPSIKATGTTFVKAFGGVISGCGGIEIGPAYYDVNSGTQLRAHVEPKPIPDIDIKKLVHDHSSVNVTPGGTYRITQKQSGGTFELLDVNGNTVTIPGTSIDQATGQLVFKENVYFTNDVRFEFPMKDNHYGTAGLRLEKTVNGYPTLYINGSSKNADSFTVFGRLEGNGSIYNTGSTKFIMQTDLVASEETGTELLSEGDINISLPASRLSNINLNLTGAVLTHGNLNATVLDPNASDPYSLASNPSTALPAGSQWPNDWVEQAYNNVAPPPPSATPTTITIPATGLSIPGSGTWPVMFVPDGDTTIPSSGLGYDKSGIPTTTSATLTVNGNGTYTFSGAKHIHVYVDNKLCKLDTMNDWFDVDPVNGTTIGNGIQVNLHENHWSTGSWIIANGYFPGGSALNNYMYNTLVKYEQSLRGNASTTPVPVKKVSGDIYAPDILITGALVVTDPNNLDGTGPVNPDAGNIKIKLVSPKDKGDFTIIHSRNYEKLLASSEIKTKIVVNTWEELH